MSRDEIRELIADSLEIAERFDQEATNYFGNRSKQIATALQQLLDYVERLEKRLEIDHAYQTGGGGLLNLERFEIPEDEREAFPDKITCLEIEVAHLKSQLPRPRMSRIIDSSNQLDLEDYIRTILAKKVAED